MWKFRSGTRFNEVCLNYGLKMFLNMNEYTEQQKYWCINSTSYCRVEWLVDVSFNIFITTYLLKKCSLFNKLYFCVITVQPPWTCFIRACFAIRKKNSLVIPTYYTFFSFISSLCFCRCLIVLQSSWLNEPIASCHDLRYFKKFLAHEISGWQPEKKNFTLSIRFSNFERHSPTSVSRELHVNWVNVLDWWWEVDNLKSAFFEDFVESLFLSRNAEVAVFYSWVVTLSVTTLDQTKYLITTTLRNELDFWTRNIL